MALDVDTAKAEARELQQEVKGRIERHPLVFLGVALGAGYVAGGGLGSAVTSQLARMGGSLAWRGALPSRPLSAPLLVGGHLLVACLENEIVAFAPDTGT